MPRFYFHLHNDIDVPDDEGAEFADLETAHRHALELTRLEIGELVEEQGRIVLSHRIDIEDEQRLVVGSVYFRDVLTIEG